MEQKPAQINWRQGMLRLVLVLFLPVGLAFLLDVWFATLPLLTMGVGLICIPLATFLVMRMTLREFDRVIAEVAPPDQDSEEDAVKNDLGIGSPDANA